MDALNIEDSTLSTKTHSRTTGHEKTGRYSTMECQTGCDAVTELGDSVESGLKRGDLLNLSLGSTQGCCTRNDTGTANKKKPKGAAVPVNLCDILDDNRKMKGVDNCEGFRFALKEALELLVIFILLRLFGNRIRTVLRAIIRHDPRYLW
jgi:hypothetical protein